MRDDERATLRYPEPIVWAAVMVGIPSWAVHLLFVASMAHFADVHPGWRWTMHVATAVTALATVAGMVLCFDLLRAARREHTESDDDASPRNLTHFLAVVGLLVGASNLALILLEGSYVILLRRHG